MLRIILIIASVWLLVTENLAAQSLSLYNIDISAHPLLKSKFMAVDANKNPIVNLTPQDIILTDNGNVVTPLRVSCPEPKPVSSVSVTLSIDISGSMSTSDSIFKTRLELCKVTAQYLINALNLPPNEIALQVCNHEPALISDFSTDAANLAELLKNIKPSGGTDYKKQLLDPKVGALNIVKRGINRRAVILFGDAMFNKFSTEDLDACKQICSDYNIIFFAVIYSKALALQMENGVYDALVQLAYSTGGNVFTGVMSEEEAVNLAHLLQSQIYGSEPCTIEWLTLGCGTVRKLQMKIPTYSLEASKLYSIPVALLPRFAYRNLINYLDFGGVQPDTSKVLPLEIQALSGDIRVSAITSSNTRFTVTDYGGLPLPFVMKSDEKRTLKIRFKPTDSNFTAAAFKIESDACLYNTFSARGGYETNFILDSTIRIIHPNGGEILGTGSIDTITWEGVSAIDTVMLEYSIDSGKTWSTATNNGSRFAYPWKVANSPSNRCLMKGTHVQRNIRKNRILRCTSIPTCVKWHNSENIILSALNEGKINLWDSKKDTLITSFNPGIEFLNVVEWSPDYKNFVCGGYSPQLLKIYSLKPLQVIKVINTEHTGSIHAICYSPDGTKIATASQDETIKVFDVNTGSLIKTLFQKNGGIFSMVWNPDGKTIAAGGFYGEVFIWDFESGQLSYSLKGENKPVQSLCWAPDGTRLIVGNEAGSVRVYSGTQLIYDHSAGGFVLTVAVNPDGTKYAAGGISIPTRIWDLFTNELILQFPSFYQYTRTISWSPDGALIATGHGDYTIRIWNSSPGIGFDVSDSLWTIAVPVVQSLDIDCGKVHINNFMDVFTGGFIKNSGIVPARIDDIRIVGDSTRIKDFQVISKYKPFTLKPGEKCDYELRFSPKFIGLYNLKIRIITQLDTLYQNLTGEGIEKRLSVITDFIDFGKVRVDSLKMISKVLLKNIGKDSISITSTDLAGPDTTQFKIIKGGSNFKLVPDENRELTISFSPRKKGRTSSSIAFIYDDAGSPAITRLFGEGIEKCDSAGFLFSEFVPSPDFNLVGTATYYDNAVRLTPDAYNTRGAIWFNKPVAINSGFTTEFRFRLTRGYNGNEKEKSNPGADGIAFVVMNNTPDLIGAAGGGIGYEGLYSSLAVEFDTFANDSLQTQDYNDPNGNHAAVQTSGIYQNTAKHNSLNTLVINPDIIAIKTDGTIFNVRIEYDKPSARLRVYLDSLESFSKPVLVLDSLDINQLLAINPLRGAFFGITAATGSSYEIHDILNWQLCGNSWIINDITDKNTAEEGEITAYPNPFYISTTLFIKNNPEENISLEVYNELGEKVAGISDLKTDSENNGFIWQPAGLPGGIYICKVSKGNSIKTFKLIKIAD